jgi:hypothetical protein
MLSTTVFAYKATLILQNITITWLLISFTKVSGYTARLVRHKNMEIWSLILSTEMCA